MTTFHFKETPMLKLDVKITNKAFFAGRELPSYATPGAAAIDLIAAIDDKVVIRGGETVMIRTGIAVDMSKQGTADGVMSLAALILPRSGIASNHGIVLGNLVGLIDSDYHGEIKVAVWNRNIPGSGDFTINPGDRITQMVFAPIVVVSLNVVDEFDSPTLRGVGGFGHTGV
jgi:dUTP pyrophosphatase